MKRNKIITFTNISVFLICTTLIFIAVFIKEEWGQVSIEQIFFNINTPFELGEELQHSILRTARQVGTIYILCVAFYIFLIIKIKNLSFYKWVNIAICFFPFMTVLFLDYEHNIIKQIKNYPPPLSMFIEENYQVEPLDATWKQKKNLVLIIAESLENTYGDPSIFKPSVIPRLEKLQQKNASFESHIVTPGTQWTIAGLISYFFGIPLKISFFGGDYGVAKYFLPNATSILKIMEDAGYTIVFLSGWDTIFSGYDKLIATHSRGENRDQVFFEKQGHSLEKFAGAWGFSDSFVFSEARSLFADSLAQKQPFALIINTIDTHHPGFSEKEFKKYNDIRDAYLSFDDQVSRFVQDIMEMDNENTSIIIIGDHLSMQNDVADQYLNPNNDKRTIYNCFINSAQKITQASKSRVFGSVDIAPTILEAIGCELPEGRFGIGVSLFRGKPTLLEQDKDKYFEEIGKRSVLYDTFLNK